MNPRDNGSPPSGVPALFALAVRHHQAGQLFDAENVYRQVLASDSRHFGSLHHLGIIALQKGQAQAAVDVISRALASNNRVPDCHYNMAFALQTLGRLSEAVGYYRQAIELKPDYVDAHTNLGNVLKELGSHREAATCYERVIALKPRWSLHRHRTPGVRTSSWRWSRRIFRCIRFQPPGRSWTRPGPMRSGVSSRNRCASPPRSRHCAGRSPR
jgi:tetratricopeptide (TPR) repeat protein